MGTNPEISRILEKKLLLSYALGTQIPEDFKKREIGIIGNKALIASSLLNVVTVVTLLAIVAGGTHNSYSIGEPTPVAQVSPSPERINLSPIKYGFNTHVHAVLDSPEDNMTLENFKRGVDILASNNLDIVRIDIRAKEIADVGGSPNEVRFNENIKVYDEAIRYAKDKGLNIFLVTNVPEFASRYSHSNYLNVTADFYTKLITRYNEYLDEEDVIQIFNEPNKHSFRDHTEISSLLSDNYLQQLSETIETGSKSIKKVNNKVIVTTNLSHWVGRGEELTEFGPAFFDEIKGIDAISLNLFPDDKEDEIERLPQYIKFFFERYQKPVYLAEIGLPTAVFSPTSQGDSLSKSIDALKRGEVRPAGIIIHELFDTTASWKEAENSFGIYTSDFSEKESANDVINAMLDI